MLSHARSKEVYCELEQGELTEFLRARPGSFDVIVSADTLVYFGDLREFCAAAAHALRPSGLVVFTLEHAVEAGDADYRLELHGRYSHRRGTSNRRCATRGCVPGANVPNCGWRPACRFGVCSCSGPRWASGRTDRAPTQPRTARFPPGRRLPEPSGKTRRKATHDTPESVGGRP